MPTATLSSKSQIVLPANIRRKLGIRPGDKLIVELEGDHAVVRKAPSSAVDALARFRTDVWRDATDELERGREEWDR